MVKKETYGKIIWGVVLLVLIFLMSMAVWSDFMVIIESIFNPVISASLKFAVALGLVSASTILVFLHILNGSNIKGKRIKINNTTFVLFGLIIFFIVSGVYLLQTQIYKKDIDLKLWEGKDGSGRIICKDINDNWAMVGDRISCEIIKPKNINNIQGTVKFIFKNDSQKTVLLDNGTFIAPDKVDYISFDVWGTDENNKIRVFKVGWGHTFLTEELRDENFNKFVSYVLGWISLVLIIIPTSIVNIRKIIFDK